MKRILFIATVVGLTAFGCGGGKDDEALPSANTAAPAVAVDPMANPAATANTAAPEAFDPTKIGPPPSSIVTVDIAAGAPRPLGNQGQPLENDLELLNYLLWNFNEGKATYSTDVIPTFKTEADALAYQEALKKYKEPTTDLNDLVKGRVIKAIPAAPAGKKYAVNPKTYKVELVDANAAPGKP